MATQQVAWTVDGFNNLAVLYPNHQTPPFTADWNIIDLTISASETVMVLVRDGAETIVNHSKETFPLQWTSTPLRMDEVIPPQEVADAEERVEAVRIDAAPDNTLYIVLNSGRLASVKLPSEEGAVAQPTFVEGVENVTQVSAASDGLVWVVCSDPGLGSVVKWMDPKKGEWNIVPDLNNAKLVTGGPKGKAFIINSANQLANYTKKGAQTPIPCDFGPRGLSIGPDGRLWVISSRVSTEMEGGSTVFYTDDDGKNWTEVEGSNVLNLDAGLIDSPFN